MLTHSRRDTTFAASATPAAHHRPGYARTCQASRPAGFPANFPANSPANFPANSPSGSNERGAR